MVHCRTSRRYREVCGSEDVPSPERECVPMSELMLRSGSTLRQDNTLTDDRYSRTQKLSMGNCPSQAYARHALSSSVDGSAAPLPANNASPAEEPARQKRGWRSGQLRRQPLCASGIAASMTGLGAPRLVQGCQEGGLRASQQWSRRSAWGARCGAHRGREAQEHKHNSALDFGLLANQSLQTESSCFVLPHPRRFALCVCACVHVSMIHKCRNRTVNELRIQFIPAYGLCPRVALGRGPLDEHVPASEDFCTCVTGTRAPSR